MDAYLLLFEVAVRHAFYAPEPCAGLRLSPTPASAAKLRRVGAVLRPTTEGVAVYVEGQRLPTLQALANDTNEPLEFYLLGRNSDPDFASATAGLAESCDQVLLFDSARAQDPDAAGWRLLHPGAHASAESAVPIHRPPLGDTPGTTTTPPLAGALPAADRRVPPAFVLRIRIETPVATLGQRWCVALQARATHWKYLLPADWAVQAPQVVDIDQRVGFEPPRPEPLDDGRSTLAARSRSAIAMQRRPLQRFQLLAQQPAADKVLVKRLPVASAGQLHMETIDGVRTLVSEIFVNR